MLGAAIEDATSAALALEQSSRSDMETHDNGDPATDDDKIATDDRLGAFS